MFMSVVEQNLSKCRAQLWDQLCARKSHADSQDSLGLIRLLWPWPRSLRLANPTMALGQFDLYLQ